MILLGGHRTKFVLAKPPRPAKRKIDGTVYVLPKEFLVNLADGRYAKLDVALVLAPGSRRCRRRARAPRRRRTASARCEQEAACATSITDVLTDQSGDESDQPERPRAAQGGDPQRNPRSAPT